MLVSMPAPWSERCAMAYIKVDRCCQNDQQHTQVKLPTEQISHKSKLHHSSLLTQLILRSAQMQPFVIISTMLAAATIVVAIPQSIGVLPSGATCLVALPDLCESGECDADTGVAGTASVVGVRVPLGLRRVTLTCPLRLAPEVNIDCSSAWSIAFTREKYRYRCVQC